MVETLRAAEGACIIDCQEVELCLGCCRMEQWVFNSGDSEMRDAGYSYKEDNRYFISAVDSIAFVPPPHRLTPQVYYPSSCSRFQLCFVAQVRAKPHLIPIRLQYPDSRCDC